MATVIATNTIKIENPSGSEKKQISLKDKEVKKKDVSQSRQKRFHRLFQQVDQDEEIIDYYSCAFVADILLQGHLYITPNYFAFYSNVFGYVTKLLIPVISVTRISKEKTAKIFPNAICILVSDDKFVFGSFLSREAAFKLMNSIWQALPRCQLELNEINTVLKPNAEVEVSECSMEEESSCSFSSSDQGGGSRSKLPISIFSLPNTKLKAPTSMQDKPRESKLSTPTSSSCTTLNTTTPPSIISGKAAEVKHFDRILFRLTLLLGLLFAISLAIFSTYLMWRIHEMEHKTNSALKFHDNLDQYTDKNTDKNTLYLELLKWQKTLQWKSILEMEKILKVNMDQVTLVRKSLEALSLLVYKTQSTQPSDIQQDIIL